MSFPKMRRKKQELETAECEAILFECSTGYLGVQGVDGYPYVVPLNYVFWNECIYFHCALSGHKVEAIKANPKVSFCVVAQDDVIPELFATAYRSVIAFGKAYPVEDPSEKRESLEMLGRKYNPDEEALQAEIEPSFDRTLIVRIEIDHLSGKQALSLV